MRAIRAGELLHGSDHEFLVNLYTTVLKRWPDASGYAHYLDRIEGHPERRRGVVEEIAASKEARTLGVAVDLDDGSTSGPAAPGDKDRPAA